MKGTDGMPYQSQERARLKNLWHNLNNIFNHGSNCLLSIGSTLKRTKNTKPFVTFTAHKISSFNDTFKNYLVYDPHLITNIGDYVF